MLWLWTTPSRSLRFLRDLYCGYLQLFRGLYCNNAHPLIGYFKYFFTYLFVNVIE